MGGFCHGDMSVLGCRYGVMEKNFKRYGKYFVYIVQCLDGSYYTGYTNDLEKRIDEHNNTKRGAKYLKGKLPVKLVWKKEYEYRHYAMRAEYRIKQLNRRQKELLVGGMRLDKVLGRQNM